MIEIHGPNAADQDSQDEQPTPRGPLYWRRIEALTGEGDAPNSREFADGADVEEMDGVSRRGFLQIMGASLALAGVSTGCSFIRKPAEQILPYAKRPEDLVPGVARHYATTAYIGGTVMGLLVESHEGRPTKIEGNPSHPGSLGGTNAWAQAEILGLYDPDRGKTPLKGGAEAAWPDAHAALAALKGAGGLAIVTDSRPSPTMRRLLAEIGTAAPGTRVFVHEPSRGNAAAGAASVGLREVATIASLEKADVIVALDCDFLGVEPNSVANSRAFASRRTPGAAEASASMNRLYVAEPSFSVTGAMADHRRRAKGSEIRAILAEIASHVLGGAPVAGADAVTGALGAAGKSADAHWSEVAAKDLAAARGKAVVLVGERQPADVHALAHLVNAALGAEGSVLRTAPQPASGAGTLADLAAALNAGEIKGLLLLGVDPAYDAPADLGFGALLAKAGTSIHVGHHAGATGKACTWHLPAAHFLESWNDFVTADGTLSVQQPLIEPLHGGISEVEVLARVAGLQVPDSLAQVRLTWNTAGATDATWRKALQVGALAASELSAPVASATPVEGATPAPATVAPASTGPTYDWSSLGTALSAPAAPSEGLELDFVVDSSVFDGRYANNGWLQELPDPMSKLTWDNAACLSPATASRLSVKNGDMVTIGAGGRSLDIAAWITPGVADDVVVLPIGYGRKGIGEVAENAGFDVNVLRTSASPWIVSGATLSKKGGTYVLATTQLTGELTETANIFGAIPWQGPGRQDLVREGTLEEYAAHPEFVKEMDVVEPEHLKSLWDEPNVMTGDQWGMTIDLSTCTGCSACTVACQAENNIPIVGKERVTRGREMHWIRVDRYYKGEAGDPQAIHQPVPCMQCENAPCEQVCPVAATAHSDDGLNDMAYNRCIGTRYCSNNCPYKVRRFNWFNFNKENDAQVPLLAMQRNPNVTVRFRGVMEKCTYCVQRIAKARIDAKVHGDGVIADGAIVTACAQACPTKAITFGNINDPASAVSKAKALSRNYAMLAELNTQPRTTYLARLRNPNPALATAPAAAEAHG